MKRHALFVGVNNYADPSIQNLAFPTEDATELASVFRRLLKFDKVEKLINPAHSPDVEDAVESMAQGLGPGDLFLFFFAGHGFRVKENHVLVCAKDKYAKLEDEYAGLPVGLLKKIMRGPWNRMLVLDACQNDIRATRGVDCGATTRDLELIHALDDGAPGAGSQIVITSCSEGQKALEVSDLKHGLFTSALLDSVTSFADSRRRIDLEGLRTDLGARMGDLIVRYRLDGRQQPMFTMPANAGGIILLDGVSSTPDVQVASLRSTPPPVSPTMAPVECPECGMYNMITNTFKCKVCGRDHLCKEHYSKDERCCADCAAKARRRAADEKAREEAARRARQAADRAEALRNGTSHETGISRTITLPGGAEMELVYCPPGEFTMGSPAAEKGQYDGETQHRVRLTKGFWLGKYPVTQRQWKSVMRVNPSDFKGDELPVETVSWDDCQAFVAKVNAALGCGARLPTEAEWEYACRAGTTTAYFWGNDLNGDRANCDGNYPCGTARKGSYLERTTPVGKYGANPWGVCDMHGNVWEWCNDWYGAYSGDAVDPTGPASGSYRVLRGGGWGDYAQDCRSASRSYNYPSGSGNYDGFRLCCSAGLHD